MEHPGLLWAMNRSTGIITCGITESCGSKESFS